MARRGTGVGANKRANNRGDYDDDEDDGVEMGKRKQRRRFVWSDDLHRDFISAGTRQQPFKRRSDDRRP